jgi:SAM-dependent methyltransferase
MPKADQPLPAPQPAVDADAFNAFESVGWEQQAPTYDRFMGGITRRLVVPLLDAAGVGPGSRVLDVATGPGYAAAEAAARGASVIGVDVAEAMVRLAAELHPEIPVRQADAERLPFGERSFDAVVSNFLVPHLGRPERAVGELVRVLDVDGVLALTAWDVPERMRVLGVVLDAVADAAALPPRDIPVGPPFFRFAADDQFAGLLRSAGLDGVEVRTIGFSQTVSTVDDLWEGILGGTVRTSVLIDRQPEQSRRRIRAALDPRIREYRHGDGFEIPVSVKVASGRKAT